MWRFGVGRYFDPRSHKFRFRIFQFSAANFFKISQNFPTFTRFLRPSPHVVPQGSRTRAPADIYDRYYSRQRDTSMSLFRSAFSKPCRMRRVCHPRAQTRLIRLRGVEGIGVWGRGRRREISRKSGSLTRKFLKISCAAAAAQIPIRISKNIGLGQAVAGG